MEVRDYLLAGKDAEMMAAMVAAQDAAILAAEAAVSSALAIADESAAKALDAEADAIPETADVPSSDVAGVSGDGQAAPERR